LLLKTTPINILNETFLDHVMNLKPLGFSQRPSLCTICYLHNQTTVASDCIIPPSLPRKSSRSHVSRARRQVVPTLSKRPNSYQRLWRASYAGAAEKAVATSACDSLWTNAHRSPCSSCFVRVCVQLFPSAQGNGSQTKSAEYENPLNSSCIACESTVGEG
jgi:hypothetical protein